MAKVQLLSCTSDMWCVLNLDAAALCALSVEPAASQTSCTTAVRPVGLHSCCLDQQLSTQNAHLHSTKGQNGTPGLPDIA